MGSGERPIGTAKGNAAPHPQGRTNGYTLPSFMAFPFPPPISLEGSGSVRTRRRVPNLKPPLTLSRVFSTEGSQVQPLTTALVENNG